jgi:hypothetical protein
MKLRLLSPILVTAILTSCSKVEQPKDSVSDSNAEQPKPSVSNLHRSLGAYGGYTLSKPKLDRLEEIYLKPMQAASFNTLDLKLQPTNLDLAGFPERKQALEDLVGRVRAHGLDLGLYLYPHPHDASRDPVASQAPAWVGPDGAENPKLYSLAHWQAWQELFSNLLELAEATSAMPVSALKIDLETMANSAISFDDQTWGKFAMEHSLDAAATRETRRKILEDAGKAADYDAAFKAAIQANLRRLADEVLKRNPKVQLGFMPAHPGNFIYEAAMTNFTRPDGSFIADDWSLYNGNGINKSVEEAHAKILKINPKATFIPWFRINNYAPGVFESHAYHAALTYGGYNFWTLLMLDPDQKQVDLALPSNAKPADYWKSLGQANSLVQARLAAGHSTPDAEQVPLTKIEPLVAQLDLNKVQFPDLPPTTAARPSGSHPLLLREQSVIFFHSRAGETTEIKIRHVAGNRQPIGLRYNILNGEKRVLRDEAISPGAEETIRFVAPETGIYALATAGGDAGPWYSIRIKDQHHALDTRNTAYFFVEKTTPAKFFAWSPRGRSGTQLSTGRTQQVSVSFGAEIPPQLLVERQSLPLPGDGGEALLPVSLGFPEKRPAGLYTQDVFVKSTAEQPTFLIPAKDFLPWQQ